MSALVIIVGWLVLNEIVFAVLMLRWSKPVVREQPASYSSLSNLVFIGRNSQGQWVAQEQNGLFGGLFVNRAQAVKYALFENGQHPETIVELSSEIELDIGRQGFLPTASMLGTAGARHEYRLI